jgi:hypothetical protein
MTTQAYDLPASSTETEYIVGAEKYIVNAPPITTVIKLLTLTSLFALFVCVFLICKLMTDCRMVHSQSTL